MRTKNLALTLISAFALGLQGARAEEVICSTDDRAKPPQLFEVRLPAPEGMHWTSGDEEGCSLYVGEDIHASPVLISVGVYTAADNEDVQTALQADGLRKIVLEDLGPEATVSGEGTVKIGGHDVRYLLVRAAEEGVEREFAAAMAQHEGRGVFYLATWPPAEREVRLPEALKVFEGAQIRAAVDVRRN